MINEWQSATRLKRGGGKQIISLDEKADELYRAEPSHDATPDKLFEKRWALCPLLKPLSASCARNS